MTPGRPFPGCICKVRNEANWRDKWLSFHGEQRFGNRRRRLDRLGLLRRLRQAGRPVPLGGLEVPEDFEGAEVKAVGGIEAALNSVKVIEGVLVGMAEGGIVLDGVVEEVGAAEVFVEAFEAVVPEVGFDAAEAALGPLGGGEGIDKRELVVAGGMELEEECGGEGCEFGWVFVVDDLGTGVDAGFECVERGNGFAFWGDGAGGFLGVQTIGVELCLGWHDLKPRRDRACGLLLSAKHEGCGSFGGSGVDVIGRMRDGSLQGPVIPISGRASKVGVAGRG
jgi:hypothetical protein